MTTSWIQEEAARLSGVLGARVHGAEACTASELGVAAVNAYCGQTLHLLPPLQGGSPAELETYLSRVEVLQALSRLFAAEPEAFLDDLARLVAGLHLLHHAGDPDALLRPEPPMLFVAGCSPDALVLDTLFPQIAPLRLELPADASVLLPGAGYASVLSVPLLAQDAGRRYLFNDLHPFPVRVARELADLLGADNLLTIPAGFEELSLPEASVDVMALSSIQGAGAASIEELARRAHGFMRPGGIVAGSCVQVTRQGEADASTILALFQDAGFELIQWQECRYELVAHAGAPEDLIHLPALQLLSPDPEQVVRVQQTNLFVAWRRRRLGATAPIQGHFGRGA